MKTITRWEQVHTIAQRNNLMSRIETEIKKLREVIMRSKLTRPFVVISRAEQGFHDGTCYQLIMTKRGALSADREKRVGKILLQKIAEAQNLLPGKIAKLRREISY